MSTIKSWSNYASELVRGIDNRNHFSYIDTLFIVSVTVDPSSPKGIGSLLLTGTIKMAKNYSIGNVAYGARITNMKKLLKNGSSPTDVFKSLTKGEFIEPSVQMGLKTGFKPDQLITDYYDDPESLNFGILMILDLDLDVNFDSGVILFEQKSK